MLLPETCERSVPLSVSSPLSQFCSEHWIIQNLQTYGITVAPFLR